MMNRIFLSAVFFLTGLLAMAQTEVRYGTMRYDSIFTSMPEYADAMQALDTLRAQYEKEAEYNEASFKRQFAEFLEGQKNFPQNILLKRQRDLQEAMEKGLAWRAEADKILQRAEEDLMRPVRARLDAAIEEVGIDRGYEAIVNLDSPSMPFLHPSVKEDATPFILKKLSSGRK